MEILKSSDSKYDLEEAMIFCKMNNFGEGIIHLYEKAKLYRLILNHYIKENNQEEIMKTCEKYENDNPNLWIDALWYFVRRETTSINHLIQILQKIEKKKLLAPIRVINILSENPSIPILVLREYLIRSLTKENEIITENERLINRYKEDTDKMRKTIEDLKTNPKIFHASKCSGCNHQLELPSVHFLCGHSFDQQCFENFSAENDSECPLCLPENRDLINLIRSQEMIQNLDHKLKQQLAEASEGDSISVVSEFFSKGIFNDCTGHLANVPKRPQTLDLMYTHEDRIKH